MPGAGKVRIMLVDDHAVVRAGYRRFLEQESDYAVVAEANSGEEAYAGIQASLPDIVILDLSMPGRGGLATLRRVKARWPLLPVLVFTMHEQVPLVLQAMRCGATGYITKSSDPSLMIRAVRSVLKGEVTLSPDVAGKLAHATSPGSADPMLGLSVREFDVFRMIANGKSHDEIGTLLNLSSKTIANYHSILRQKLGVHTDIELFQLASDCEIVDGATRPGADG
jgi:two-component system, NarL family, invasion response regulator UvrY